VTVDAAEMRTVGEEEDGQLVLAGAAALASAAGAAVGYPMLSLPV
jgi:hypothetical protein